MVHWDIGDMFQLEAGNRIIRLLSAIGLFTERVKWPMLK